MEKCFKSAVQSFALTFLVLTVVASAVCYGLYSREVEALDREIRNDEDLHSRMLSTMITLDLQRMFNELLLVANHSEVRRFMSTRSNASRKEVEKEFKVFCNISKAYDQVRILGIDGMELVRVNYNAGYPAAVPKEDLQNKSNRYYFIESMKLVPGEVYVSPFDLNIEHGEIEQPLKPMIRASTSILDDYGGRQGVLILNYLGQFVLDNITALEKGDSEHAILLNEDGYVLKGPDKSMEWAFMYKDRLHMSFKSDNPDEWSRIRAADSGQFTSDLGLVTFATIVVAPDSNNTFLNTNTRRWRLVCLIPAADLARAHAGAVRSNWLLFFGSLLGAVFVAYTRSRFVYAKSQNQMHLEEAKRLAEEANRAKSDFLARMSHEIRTPMNAIIGLTHLALKVEMTPKVRDYLSKVLLSAKSLLGIINDVLDFSKIEAGRMDMQTEDFLLDDVFNDLINMLSLQAEEKGVKFLVMVKSSVPNQVRGDRLRLGQVLLNLTGNAIKFTEEGEVLISAELMERKGNTALIRFSVKDSGIGINDEQRQHLFQPFSQADGSITRQFGGTGLGLTISKRLVEMMGGEMHLESEYGLGSEFCFVLPLELQETQEASSFEYPEDIRGMHVLVVDDCKISRMVLEKVLSSFSFRVDCAESGAEALEMLRQSDADDPYGLVVTDWRMPDIDGIELAGKIKSGLVLRSIPKVIMLTAYSRDEVRMRAEQVNLDGFMLKPCNRSILFDTIMQVFFGVGDDGSVVGQRETMRCNLPGNLAGARVLLAEDNEINQQVALEILESAGVRVSVAGDGQQAVDMVREGAFDLVLMDIQMPVMDGLQAAKALREDPKSRTLPIVAMTAHAMVGDREKSLLAGMDDHITKPIDPDALVEVVSRWLPGAADATESSKPCLPGPDVVEEDIVDLFGVDVADGLARVRGNKTLYMRLLAGFARDFETMHGQLMEYAEADRPQDMIPLAHTMKGIAGNIGAKGLQRMTASLESALRQGGEELAPHLDRLGEEMRCVLDSIREKAPAPEAPEGTGQDDPVNVGALRDMAEDLERLMELLRQHDAAARDLFQKLQPALSRADTMSARAIGLAMEQFDMKRAGGLVQTLLELARKENGDG